ncbi:MAG: divergent polysaccharide deacetylase family protein [Candidatus Omnitrophica bacterium]|nr:divergent polysaccharide deacetylase family protein [Candidatus Omnitrophota bacterium]MDD5553141.1 divergent polysaccharide deacetylase family protein [Candidatus Omnitrophota bacterium]
MREARYKKIVWALSFLVFIESSALIFLFIKLHKKAPRAAAIKGKIAIVLDDWGYNNDNLDTAARIKYPFTASVLPGLPYSRAVAQELNKNGVELLLHLPMEPKEKYNLEKNTIKSSMDKQSIARILERGLADIQYARGVNNHMGSKVTEDYKTIGVILSELKKRRLFFLDSLVTSQSVCQEAAQKARVGFAKRDIFLDNTDEPQYIKGQLSKLKKKARLHGSAIAIGHDRKNTLEVLEQEMPKLEKEGYKLVFVSELIKY